MNCLKITAVCVTVLGTAYVSESYRRNMTYFQDEVCGLRVPGPMSTEALQKFGSHLKESAKRWLKEMNGTLQHWPGPRSWKEGCRIHGRKKTLKNIGTIPVMFFLEYLTILQETEEKKASRMLFLSYSKNSVSLNLINDTTSDLCYLLAGLAHTHPEANNVRINLCSSVVQRSNVTEVMKLIVRFGHCLSKYKSVSSCTKSSGVVQGCYESPRRKKTRCRRCKTKRAGQTRIALIEG